MNCKRNSFNRGKGGSHMIQLQQLNELLETSYDQMVATRRYLHQHPELSFQEFKTAAYIQQFYQTIEVPYRHSVGGNGVVATIDTGKPGQTIAIRADFDALPIQDEKDVPYRSTVPHVMHACGHDGHTATALYLAKAIQAMKEQLVGRFVFIHQHAEELSPGGAKTMIEDGALDGVDEIYATHLWSLNPLGTIETRVGALMAAADRFSIHVKGIGGHGANPHESVDAIAISAQLITQLQHIVSRETNPMAEAVLSVGKIEAGEAFNIIAGEATMEGTVRTFDTAVQNNIIEAMERICNGVALTHRCEITLDYTKGYPPLINSKQAVDAIETASQTIDALTFIDCVPYTIGEDFAYFTQHVPGAMFLTGAKKQNGPVYPHHHPKFDFEESAMLDAAKLLGALLIQRSQQN